MKAILKRRVIAQSDDVVACGGYQYFPADAVRMEWLRKARRTASDNACPHGVRFYDAVIDGERYRRVAWNYEAPLPRMKQTADRFGFWGEVNVR